MKKLILLFFVFSSFALFAQTQETDSIQNRVWFDKGVDPFVSYVSIAAANVSGGVDQTSKYAGQLYTGLSLDFEKILGWKGTRGKISMINRHGKGLMNDVGSVFEPLNMVGGQNTFVYDLSIEKDFGKHFSLKAGRTTAADDFSGSKLYYYALNNTVNGVIRALLLDGLMSTFPFATWGTRLKYKPNTNHQFQLGVYQMGKDIFDDTKHGLDFSFRSSDNLSIFFQYDWFGKVANRNARVYLGANQVFGAFENFNPVNESDYFMRLYGHVDVELIEGLTSFLTISYSPHGEIAKVPFQSSLGINWKGLIPSRAADRVLFFATIGSFSEEWASLKGDTLSSEVVLELGYRFQIADYFALQPALQYDINPGGSGRIDNAFIPGILIEANF
ncbi:OprB family porin [Maribacter vaceletii]|uniref:OprB family porin n=1 Tax=Maribacter vaceletii TaxID=1206816 RepID=A0A495EEZ0_9FLAO|nr:carbohydrate porin [Maribacter vaceletii]RKR14457.1 OprB family porin [Maribacter vaceletii]